MADFPITYSKATPSGRGGAVPINVDVSTGADYIAQGMYNLGEAFDVVARRKEQTELSEMYRELDEKSFTYFSFFRNKPFCSRCFCNNCFAYFYLSF